MTTPRIVVLTGAAGSIGRSVTPALAARYQLVGLDIRPLPADFPGRAVVGDCADPAVAWSAVEDADAVVHLAGIPNESALPVILRGHVETTAALLDAMVRTGATRMVYASSNHAVGRTPRPRDGSVLEVTTPPRPDTFYGVGKVAAEALLSLYADRHQISSVAMRIGSFLERPATKRALSTWLSPGDCARMIVAALEADFSGVRPIYGISANTDAWWDLDAGRAIGYDPLDDAAGYAGDIPDRAEDADENSVVGGPYALPAFVRPAFDD